MKAHLPVLILLALLAVGVLATMPAQAWVPGYAYVQTHTITGSPSGAQTSYPVFFYVMNTTGTSAGNTIYTGGHMQNFPYDIRFANATDTVLHYYNFTIYNATTVGVFVELDSVPASPDEYTLKIYYGNVTDTGASNGTNVFTFYDDFNAYNTTDWTTKAGKTDPTASNGILTTPATSQIYSDTKWDMNSYALGGVVKTSSNAGYNLAFGTTNVTPTGSGAKMTNFQSYGDSKIHQVNTLGGTGDNLNDFVPTINYTTAYYYTVEAWRVSGTMYMTARDYLNVTGRNSSSTYALAGSAAIFCEAASGQTVAWDNVWVRKHAAVEPAHGAYAAETPAPTPTPTPPTLTPTPYPVIGPPPSGKEYLYITNSYSGTVAVVDTATDALVNRIPVSSHPGGAIPNPGGTYIAAAGYTSPFVAIYSTLDQSLVKTIDTAPYNPEKLAVSQNGEWMFALSKQGSYYYIQTFDMKTLTLAGTYNTTQTTGLDIEATQHGEYALVACQDHIIRYNRTTGGVSTYYTTPYQVWTLSLWGNDLFVAGGGGTFVYSPTTNTVLADYNFTYPDNPYHCVVNPGEGVMYLSMNAESTNVTKANLYTGEVMWNVTLTNANSLATGSNGVYVGMLLDNKVCHIDANGSIIGYIATGNYPYDVEIGNIMATGAGMQYVTFQTKTLLDTLSVSDVNLTVYDASNRLLYAGLTDGAGSCTFYMSGVQNYRVLVTQGESIYQWYNVTPAAGSYVIRLAFADVIGITRPQDEMVDTEELGQALYTFEHSYNSTTGQGWMNATYSGTKARSASSVGFALYRNGTELGGSDVLVESVLDSSAPFENDFSIASATGNSYYVKMTVNETGGGTRKYAIGLSHTFQGPKVLANVMPADWYFWLAWGIVLSLYAAGTVTKKGIIGVLGAAMGMMFVNWGWYSLVIPYDALMYAAIGFTFILSIVMTMIERERYT
jgi:YVTN family beta-propeller protein